MKLDGLFISIALLTLFSACDRYQHDNPQKSAATATVSVPPFVIDAHVHYKANDQWEKSFLEVYSRHHAMACLMVKMEDLDRGIKFYQAHPDRVIPYAMIDIDAPTVLQDVRKVHEMGYKGLGEFFAKNDWNYDEPKYEPLWTLAEELRMPLAPIAVRLRD